MNKFQKVCLLISILVCIDISMDALLHMSFILRFLKEGSFFYHLYTFVIGIVGFVNLLLFKKED